MLFLISNLLFLFTNVITPYISASSVNCHFCPVPDFWNFVFDFVPFTKITSFDCFSVLEHLIYGILPIKKHFKINKLFYFQTWSSFSNMNIYDKNSQILAKKRMPAFCVCKVKPIEYGNCSFCRLMLRRCKQKQKKKHQSHLKLVSFAHRSKIFYINRFFIKSSGICREKRSWKKSYVGTNGTYCCWYCSRWTGIVTNHFRRFNGFRRSTWGKLIKHNFLLIGNRSFHSKWAFCKSITANCKLIARVRASTH